MAIFNKRDEYGWLAIVLHWLLFVLIVGLLASGKFSASLSSDDKIGFLIGAHKQIGMAALILMLFRLLWRLVNETVWVSEQVIVRFLTQSAHWLMYLVVLAQAMTGVMMTQLADRSAQFLGVFTLPSFTGLGRNILSVLPSDFAQSIGAVGSAASQMNALHGFLGNLLIVLILLHVGYALFHHIFYHDEVLRRIFFGYKPPYANYSDGGKFRPGGGKFRR